MQHSVWHYGGRTLEQSAAVRYSSPVPAWCYKLSIIVTIKHYTFNRLQLSAEGTQNTATTPSRNVARHPIWTQLYVQAGMKFKCRSHYSRSIYWKWILKSSLFFREVFGWDNAVCDTAFHLHTHHLLQWIYFLNSLLINTFYYLKWNIQKLLTLCRQLRLDKEHWLFSRSLLVNLLLTVTDFLKVLYSFASAYVTEKFWFAVVHGLIHASVEKWKLIKSLLVPKPLRLTKNV